MDEKDLYINFDEYIRQGETQQIERAEAWRVAITRTTAVFIIKYLRSQGFDVNNELFERHSWYFRNALVRANYRNLKKGINYESIFLVRFFRNLLLGENNTLKNRYMMIDGPEEWKMPESEKIPYKLGTSTGQVQDKYRTSCKQATIISSALSRSLEISNYQ